MQWIWALFYSGELRRAISELQSKGDFRPAGLNSDRLSVAIAWLLIIGLSAAAYMSLEPLWPTLCIFIIVYLLLSSLRAKEIRRNILLYSFGEYTTGIVTWRCIGRHGWLYSYDFETPDGSTHKGTIDRVRKVEYPGRNLPQKGDPICVFYSPYSPKLNMAFTPARFATNCISQSRVNHMCELLEDQTWVPKSET